MLHIYIYIYIYIYDISTLRVKLGTFRWAGHVRRMEVSGLAEKILCTKPEGNGERRGGNSEVEVVR